MTTHLYTKISYPAKFENQQIIVNMHTQVLITKPLQNFINKQKKNFINKEKKINFYYVWHEIV
jgi:hypothetical protein